MAKKSRSYTTLAFIAGLIIGAGVIFSYMSIQLESLQQQIEIDFNITGEGVYLFGPYPTEEPDTTVFIISSFEFDNTEMYFHIENIEPFILPGTKNISFERNTFLNVIYSESMKVNVIDDVGIMDGNGRSVMRVNKHVLNEPISFHMTVNTTNNKIILTVFYDQITAQKHRDLFGANQSFTGILNEGFIEIE